MNVGETGIVLWEGDTTADRGGWLAARNHGVGIGSSDVAAMVGLSSWSSPFDLYWRLIGGDADEVPVSDAMHWGSRLETVILDEYADRHPAQLLDRRGLVVAHTDRPWQRCSPDALATIRTTRPDGTTGQRTDVVEVKTSGSRDGWGGAGTDEIPVAYRCQVMWQMDTVGADRAVVPVLFGDSDYREYSVAYDPADAQILRAAAVDLVSRVEHGRCGHPERWAPDVDAHKATGARLRRLHHDLDDTEVDLEADLGAGYLAACTALAAAETARDYAAARVLAAMGDARWAYTGDGVGRTKVATRSVSCPARVDVAALRAAHPNIVAAHTRSADTPQVRLLPALPRPTRTIKDVTP